MEFYNRKKVLVTGHTGFKGSWMCRLLLQAGAEVTGYALQPPTDPALFTLCGLDKEMSSVEGDIRDLAHLQQVMDEVKPEIVIHMAAQPIVRASYQNPVYTYETNVMGTVHLLEAVRHCPSVVSVVNVTTDKVYRNREWAWGYRENEELNGFDPYSNSKSCSELVTSSYRNSFFADGQVAITTCRAGNVIGGGDFAADRIIPDCIRAVQRGEEIIVRNPASTRPYQFVLEPVYAYLMIAARQYTDKSLAGCYNIGPDDKDCLTTGELVTLFCDKWNAANGTSVQWKNVSTGGPHEASFLKLDCSKAESVFGWKPGWGVEDAIANIVDFSKIYLAGGSVRDCMDRQIAAFLQEAEK